MLAFLGHWLVLLAIASCVFVIGATAWAFLSRSARAVPGGGTVRALWLEAAHNGVFVCWAFVLAACVLLVTAFLTDNFSLQYVWSNSSRAQPTQFKISALWGGQGGSLLLWTFVLASYALVVSRSGRKSGHELVPSAVAVITATTAFFAGLVAFNANPFTLITSELPPDGRGMNPLLQNYWMQIHPPTLYLGYVGTTVPFAFAVSALLHRRFDESWSALIRRWVLFTWIVLTLGIVMGGVWAYETLGWGGYWAWDPVENASLMPWLCATAFLHSIMLQARRGLLKNWNISLVTLTFLLSIFGTFITRSGIIESVHSFAESDIGGYFLGFIGITMLLTGALIWWRREELISPARIESAFSREGFFMINNYLLLAGTFAVLWGTVFPTLSDALGTQKVVVDQAYFNRIMVPIGLALLALTGVGPLLAWRKSSPQALWKVARMPILWTLALSPLLWLLAQWRTGAATAFMLALFVFLAIGSEVWRGVKTLRAKRGGGVLDAGATLVTWNPARYGGYIVHLGVAIMIVGFAGSGVFGIEHPPRTLTRGETMALGEYTLRFDGLARPEVLADNLTDQIVAMVSVFDARGNQLTSERAPLDPRIDFFKDTGMPNPDPDAEPQTAQRPAIRSTPANDIYLVLTGFNTEDNSADIKTYLNPLVMWIWISQIFFVLGTVVSFLPPARGGRGSATSPPASQGGSASEPRAVPAPDQGQARIDEAKTPVAAASPVAATGEGAR